MRSLYEILEDFTEIIDILVDAAMVETDEELVDRIEAVEQELYDYARQEELNKNPFDINQKFFL